MLVYCVTLNKLFGCRLIGGKAESHANIAEGLATALQCFEELHQKRDSSTTVQKHCILVCNSPPYLLPVMESHTYSGKTAEQLAGILQEVRDWIKGCLLTQIVFEAILK